MVIFPSKTHPYLSWKSRRHVLPDILPDVLPDVVPDVLSDVLPDVVQFHRHL